MQSDSTTRHLETEIKQLQVDFQKLLQDDSDMRDRAQRAMKRIQVDLDHRIDLNERKRRELQNKLSQRERELEHKREELERITHKSHR